MTGRGFNFVIPGAPETPTGGFVYDRHMLTALRRAGRLERTIVLSGAYPHPGAATHAAAARALAEVPDSGSVIVDGLALTPLRETFAAAAGRLVFYALVHHPLGDETGLPEVVRQQLHAAERQALELVRGIVVTSAHTAARLADFGVEPERVRVVRPGIDLPLHRTRPRRRNQAPPVLLCVGSLTPRKGQDVLLRALCRLRRLPWRLLLVGPERDAAFSRRLRRLAADLDLAGRIELTGALDARQLADFYQMADVFVFPSHYEGFGMAAAEAAGYGLPIVASDAGAIAEALAGTRHRLVPPGDPAALANALRPFLTRPGWAVRAPVAAARSRTWRTASAEFVAALDALAAP